MSKISQFQLRQMLNSAVGRPQNSPWPDHHTELDEDLHYICQEGCYLQTPEADMSKLFVLPDRIAVLKDVNLKRRSVLAQCLSDRNEETALVVDSFLSGKDALFFVCLLPNSFGIGIVDQWMQLMSPGSMSFTIKPIDDNNQIMAASLNSFVFHGVS
jgi:hypothetical protein